MTAWADHKEYAGADEQFFNYCLWEYPPLAPFAGKFKSANLLYHSFEVGGAHENCLQLVRLIRESLGAGNTVWGVKWTGAALKWELYFYDYRRSGRSRSIQRLLEAIAPLASCRLATHNNPNYFMFSVDIDGQLLSGSRDVDEIHLYVGNVGSTVSSGISYSLTGQGMRLENLYYFFDPKCQLSEIRGKICSSAFLDVPTLDPELILWPELADCSTICLANKQGNDCIYFSGINLNQLLFALETQGYPQEITGFMREHRSRLDHLRYDFGIDYTIRQGRMSVVKSGYYGTF